MFDPARDDDAGHRRFYRRILVIFAVGCLSSVALWPSLTGFTAGSDVGHTCVAIVDALRHDSVGGADEFSEPDAGACVDESRHRLLLSGGGLGAIALLVGGVAVVRARHGGRRETRSRRPRSPDANEPASRRCLRDTSVTQVRSENAG